MYAQIHSVISPLKTCFQGETFQNHILLRCEQTQDSKNTDVFEKKNRQWHSVVSSSEYKNLMRKHDLKVSKCKTDASLEWLIRHLKKLILHP